MKTKSICISLVIMLLCISASARPCVCPQEQLQQGVNVVLSTMAAAGDLCSDCGHTKSCCVSHKDMPIAGSVSITQTHEQLVPKAVVVSDLSIPSIYCATIASSLTNRAPPWNSNQTPISLHQKLSI